MARGIHIPLLLTVGVVGTALGGESERPRMHRVQPMSVQLVLVYCLTAEPSRCIEQRPLPADHSAGLMACLTAAQIEAARWLVMHPDYFLAEYRCEIGNRSPERGT